MLTSSLYVITSMLMPMTMPMSSYWRQGDEKKSVTRRVGSPGRPLSSCPRGAGEWCGEFQVGPDWHTSDTLSWLCGPKHQRPLSEGSKLAGTVAMDSVLMRAACVIRTESKLAGMICVNMSGGRSSLGAMEYGKPTGHVLGFLYGRWHASRGPFSHLQVVIHTFGACGVPRLAVGGKGTGQW